MTNIQEAVRTAPGEGVIGESTKRSRQGVLALAMAESWRLLVHPAVLAAFSTYFAQWVYVALQTEGDRYAVLHDESRFSQIPWLLVAVGVFVATHLAVLRPAREALDDLYEVAVLEPWHRVTAHLMSVLPLVGIAVAVTLARIAYLASRPGAVGDVSVSELLTGPTVVLVAGALAVLLGSLFRSTAAGPLILTGLAVITVAGALSGASPWKWLTLVAVEDESIPPLPSALLDRPSGLHLLYLIFLTTLMGLAALLRSGKSSRVLVSTSVIIFALVVTAGAGQLRAAPSAAVREKARMAPAEQQRCVSEGVVTYCAFPEFLDRHHQWAQVANGVLQWVPTGEKSERYFVRQRVWKVEGGDEQGQTLPIESWTKDDRQARTPESVTVGTRWGTSNDSAASTTIGFAASFADRAFGSNGEDDSPVTQVCGARSLVLTWLAAQATTETEDALRMRLSAAFQGSMVSFHPADGVTTLSVDRRGVDAAVSLLARPAADIGPKVKQSWATLTDPDTSLERAAELLGAQLPSSAESEGESVC